MTIRKFRRKGFFSGKIQICKIDSGSKRTNNHRSQKDCQRFTLKRADGFDAGQGELPRVGGTQALHREAARG